MSDDLTPEQLAELKEKLSNWRWRFTNLYWIEPAEEGVPEMLFTPRDEQWQILEDIYENGCTRLAILKARQLGFSTLLALICLDKILFNAGYVCGLVDQTQDDAKKKMRKIQFAWMKLPTEIRECFIVTEESKSEFGIQRPGRAKSTVYAGMNARGGTHQFLWISEWGAIQHDDPERSDNIADGALPSAEQGTIVVETTWKGGKTGRLYTEVVEPSLKMLKKYRTREDWQHRFYPWWLDERYNMEGDPAQITKECLDYLAEVEEDEWIEIPESQKLWYFKKAWPKRAKRYEEYPSRLKEIFMSPVEGAIYGPWMDEAMVEGRVVDFVLGKPPVIVSWDIGKSDLMCLTFIQVVGMQPRVFDAHFDRGATLEAMARYCQNWEKKHGAVIGHHMLPHDAEPQRIGKNWNKSVRDLLGECGIKNTTIVPVIPMIGMGIDYVRDRLPTMIFHATNLSRVYEFGSHRLTFLDAMNNYRFGPVDKQNLKAMPIHDIYSHPCDSLRTYAEGDERGLVPRLGSPGDDYQDDNYNNESDTGFNFWND